MSEQPYQLFDALPADDYEALKRDISERGILVPVELDETGNILDGHHRVMIAGELGIKDYPRIVRVGLSEQDKRNHVRALNILRRHLDRDARGKVFSEMHQDGMSARAIASATGVTHPTVLKALESTGGKDLPRQTVTGKDGKTYPATSPDDSDWMTWDGVSIDTSQLKRLLRFEIDPRTVCQETTP